MLLTSHETRMLTVGVTVNTAHSVELIESLVIEGVDGVTVL